MEAAMHGGHMTKILNPDWLSHHPRFFLIKMMDFPEHNIQKPLVFKHLKMVLERVITY
jgi:hypothetical protein